MMIRRLTALEAHLVARTLRCNTIRGDAYHVYGAGPRAMATKLAAEGFMQITDIPAPSDSKKPTLRYMALWMTEAGKALWEAQEQFSKTLYETRYAIPWEDYDLLAMARTMPTMTIAREIGVSHTSVLRRIRKLAAESGTTVYGRRGRPRGDRHHKLAMEETDTETRASGWMV